MRTLAPSLPTHGRLLAHLALIPAAWFFASGCPNQGDACDSDADCFATERCVDTVAGRQCVAESDLEDASTDTSRPTDAPDVSTPPDSADATLPDDGADGPGDTGGENTTSKVDLLWVIDNSGSMCEEQELLRDNFDALLDELVNSAADFHLAVTTTHFERENIQLEPIASGGRLQSTPSPVPFPSKTCRFAADSEANIKDEDHPEGPDFAPIVEAVDQAIACAEGDFPDLADPSDDRIACAIYGTDPPDGVTSGNPCERAGATKHDGRIYVNDLFPCGSQYDPEGSETEHCPGSKMREVYRDIPRVIRSDAPRYRNDDGSLDRETLERDFACMSFVGTRGNGEAEQGLKALTKAVAPDMTGGPAGEPIEEYGGEEAPNHGFLRRDANFATVFVSDENDCSYGEGWDEYLRTSREQNSTRDRCGGANCYFPTRNAEDQSPLQNVDELLGRFKSNLAESKQIPESRVEEMIASPNGGVTMASMDGGYQPFSGAPPSSCEDVGSVQPLRCASQRGEIFTGDRYHDFLRQFGSHYPTEETGLGSRSKNRTRGLLCRGTFSGSLEGIGQTVIGSR